MGGVRETVETYKKETDLFGNNSIMSFKCLQCWGDILRVLFSVDRIKFTFFFCLFKLPDFM